MPNPDGSPNPPTEHSQLSASTAMESSGKRFQLIVVGLVLILLGSCAGAVLVLSLEHFGSQTRFYGWTAIFAAAAAALLLVITLFGIARWLWRHRGHHLFGQTRDAFDALMSKPPALPWTDHLTHIWLTKGRLLWNALFVTLALWAGVALLSPLVMGLFSFAGYLSSQAQVQVTVTQNRIVAIEQEFQQANAYAEQRFAQISKILLNADASPAEQTFALREVPDAMCITVPRAVLDEPDQDDLRVTYTLPNLRRLRDVVRQYVSMDRLSGVWQRSSISQKDDEPLADDAMEALQPQKSASTELFHLLHRLGPPDAARPNHCLWIWSGMQNDDFPSQVVAAFKLDDIPKPRHALDDRVEGTLNFSHLGERDLEGAVAPLALSGVEWRIISHKRLSFRHAKLQGANFSSSELRMPDFDHAQLQRAYFAFAQFQECNFNYSQMQRCMMKGARLQGSSFVYTNLQHADFTDANLQGSRLICSQLQNAWLHDSQMQGALLIGTELQGAVVQSCPLEGAVMTGVGLQGTHLSSPLRNTRLDFARVAGENLSFADRSSLKPGQTEVGPASERSRAVVHVVVPGAYLDSPEAWTPNQILEIKIDDVPAFQASLTGEFSPTESADVSQLSHEAHERLKSWILWIPYAPKDMLGKLPWPAEFEPIIKKVVGSKNITKSWNGVMVVLGINERVHFSSPVGAVWMTAELRENLLKSLDSEPYVTMTKQSPDAVRLIEELRHELTYCVNHPGKFTDHDAWEKALTERNQWNLKEAYEEALKAKIEGKR